MNGLNAIYVILEMFLMLVIAAILLLICWLLDKHIFHRKFKLKYRVILSVAIPVILLVASEVYDFFAPYSETRLSKELKEYGLQIELPSYKIVDYREENEADDIMRTFELEFVDDVVTELIPSLDSLCDVCVKSDTLVVLDCVHAFDPWWSKEDECYKFTSTDLSHEVIVTLTICPRKRTAEYQWLRW